MSRQIIVYGFIEIPIGSEGQNVIQLEKLKLESTVRNGWRNLASAVSEPVKGWPSSMLPFARSYKGYKSTAEEDCDDLQYEFEHVLMSLEFISAHLSVEDEERAGERHFDYVNGPAKFGGPNVLRRIPLRRTAEEPVVFERPFSSSQ